MANSDRSVLGIVPCRLDSTRFPGKALARLAGVPLVEHARARLLEAASVDAVLVATDSAEIAAVVREAGGDVAFVREPCATGSDRSAAAVRGRDADVVVSLQVDQPCIHPDDIDAAIALLDAGFDITTLGYPCRDEEGYRDPNVVKVVTADARALYFSRAPIPSGKGGMPAQEATDRSDIGLYLHHVGLYCFRRAALDRFASLARGRLESMEGLEQLRALEGGLSIGVAIASTGRPGVDHPDDLVRLERLIAAGDIRL